MITICRRELAAAYHSFTGWLIALTVLVVGGIFSWVYCCLQGSVQFEYVIASLEIVLILVVPVLSMRSIAEERKQRTDQLLYSLPVRISGIVLGKFLAMILVLAVPLVVLGLYPLVLSVFGSVNLTMAYGNLFAFFLLACTLTALGEFISACTDNPTVALILALLSMLLCYFLSSIAALIGDGNAFTAFLSSFLEMLSLFQRQIVFRAGLFDLSAVAYYMAATAAFLALTVLVMERRRWH